MEERRLACPVRPDKRRDLAERNDQTHILKRLERAEAFRNPFNAKLNRIDDARIALT